VAAGFSQLSKNIPKPFLVYLYAQIQEAELSYLWCIHAISYTPTVSLPYSARIDLCCCTDLHVHAASSSLHATHTLLLAADVPASDDGVPASSVEVFGVGIDAEGVHS